MSDQVADLTLVFGGASSGKSQFAEAQVEAAAPKRLYIATALGGAPEMDLKIERHKARRGAGWSTFEMDASDDLPDWQTYKDHAVLFDCATLWLGLRANGDWEARLGALLEELCTAPMPVVIVSNELGMGLVPEHAATRQFRDAHGTMNQTIAARAQRVVFVAAGLPLILKGATS